MFHRSLAGKSSRLVCGFATRLVVVSSLLQHVGWVHAQLAVNGVVTTWLFESPSVVETSYAPARHYASRFSHSCWGFSKYVYNLVSSEDKYSMCWLCKLLENGLVKWWLSKMVKRNWQPCLQMLLQLQIVLPSSSCRSIHNNLKRQYISHKSRLPHDLQGLGYIPYAQSCERRISSTCKLNLLE